MSVSVPEAPQALKPRRISGPSAFGGGLRRFFHLTWTIAITEFKLTYFGSALGYFWSLAQPLLLFGILYLVFTQVFDVGAGAANYPVLLLFNIVLFSYFQAATGECVKIVEARENLVRKMHFPRLVIPLSTVLTGSFNLLLNLLAVFVFVIGFGIEPTATWLLLPVLVTALIWFTASVGMILSVLYIRYRDVAPIWGLISTAMFYGSPVLYPIDKVPATGPYREIILANPVAALLQQGRSWIIDPNAPGINAATGHSGWFLIPLTIALVICVFGLWFFNREAPRIAEEL